MKKASIPRQKYMQRIRANRRALWVEILLTLCITLTVVVIGWSALYHEARQYASEIGKDYQSCVDSYIKIFNSMLVSIKEKIEEEPSFDEMQAWLQSREDEYTAALGGDMYDGIAFTYKGGYAHSWNYGDYSDYDPNTRPWYRQAQEAAGEVTVVAPYVTYLDTSYLNSDQYILMTIAQRYNEEISFDLDIKISDVEQMLTDRELLYTGEKMVLYDANGYILSSNTPDQFAHNMFMADEVISQNYADAITRCSARIDKLQLARLDGVLQYIYFYRDANANTICMMFPFWRVLCRNFLPILIISLCMIAFEWYLYLKNRKVMLELNSRDQRMSALADATYKERLYVNLDKMTFYGSDEAERLCAQQSYSQLYNLMLSRMPEESEREQLRQFMSEDALKAAAREPYKMVSRRFVMVMRQPDGSMVPRTMELARLNYELNGQSVAAVAMRDVSEDAETLKDALKQAESASQAKGSFLSKMSHEIRTPLNAVIGYLAIAKDSQDQPEKVQHCIDNSEVAAKHLLQIINDVLDMSSIESGKMKIANEDFHLKKEISDITTIFYQNAKIKGVRFETRVDDLTEEWVMGDPLRLNQVLANLLSNAVKFTPEGGLVSLKIRQLRQDAGRVYLQFVIADSGIGMSEEYMQRLFQPFEQESASTARKYGGSGLGLSITSNLVSMMGGSIQAESKQGVGTTFTVTLPFGLSGDHRSETLTGVDYSHVRALVVDDQPDECTYVKTMLRRCGVKADTVTSGAEALKRIRSRAGGDYSYDLCILDWSMPEMNGVEVASRIREEFGSKLPIIIATAYDVSELADTAKEAGVNKVIAKPLFQSTLFDLLVSTFGRYDPEAKSAKKAKRADLTGTRVLLAEDNAMNMEIAVAMLEKAGVVVTQAVNGAEACEKFLAAPAKSFDVILMDVQMPVMDGYEATRKIRAADHPEAKTIPIVAMTANAFAEDVAAALSNGMNAHIAKPINYDKLFAVLEEYENR